LTPWNALPRASAVVAAVSHREYLDMGVAGVTTKLARGGVFVDVKSCYDEAQLASAGVTTWRL
jgi:UDP-N-acetyl-D-glucosamine/UDP-N-acetyl-D-galactosamine dehydrogenase